MIEPTIKCPKCSAEIKLTDAMAAPLVQAAREQFENQITQKEREWASKLDAEKSRIAAEEAEKARKELADSINEKSQRLTELENRLQEQSEKLGEAQKAQAKAMREQRELEEARREMDLTIEKRVGEELSLARDKARQEAEVAIGTKLAEKEHTIVEMQKQIEELRRKAEQGSQQRQGEVLEIQLESVLRTKFPLDQVEEVKKGEFGGDIIHRVQGATGECGSIIIECKNTKTFSRQWLPKLRGDQRAAKADMSVLVTQAMPDGVEGFDIIDNVYVVSPDLAVSVIGLIRESLNELYAARKASEGQKTKMEELYTYLVGPKFKARVSAVVEKLQDMRDDLDREKKAAIKALAKRETQIGIMVESLAGLHGDVCGIAGRSILEIEALEMPALPEPEGA